MAKDNKELKRLWILAPAFVLIYRFRGMDTPKWLPISTRIVAALLLGGVIYYQCRDPFLPVIWALGWFLSVLGGWWPKENWSATAPVNLRWWLLGSARHVLYSIVLFSAMIYYLHMPWILLPGFLASVAVIPFYYWFLGPNQLNLPKHTVWAECFIGLHWFLIYATNTVLKFFATM